MKGFFEDMSKCFKIKNLKRGDLLFHVQEEGDEMVIILDGVIECAIPKTDEEKGRELKNLDHCWDKLVAKSSKSGENMFIGFRNFGIKGEDREEILRLVKILYPINVWRELSKL
jgi:hypothetical protein